MHHPVQLELFLSLQPQIKVIHDPYWDELEAQTDDIVDDALLSINAENEVFDIDVEIAPQQITVVGEQISFDETQWNSVGEQVASDTLKVAPQHNGKLYDPCTEENQIAPQQITVVRAQLSFDVPESTNTVRAQVNSDTAPEHNYPESSVNSDTSKPYTHWVEKYWVKRRGEKHEYYRYCWMEGRKKYRSHIGGRAGSVGAIQRKELVIEAIRDGESPQQIKELIRQFNNPRCLPPPLPETSGTHPRHGC